MYPRIPKSEQSCLNCSWFDFNYNRIDAFGKPIKPMNRECLHPGPITVKYGRCACWKDMRTLKQKLRGEFVQKPFC